MLCQPEEQPNGVPQVRRGSPPAGRPLQRDAGTEVPLWTPARVADPVPPLLTPTPRQHPLHSMLDLFPLDRELGVRSQEVIDEALSVVIWCHRRQCSPTGKT